MHACFNCQQYSYMPTVDCFAVNIEYRNLVNCYKFKFCLKAHKIHQHVAFRKNKLQHKILPYVDFNVPILT